MEEKVVKTMKKYLRLVPEIIVLSLILAGASGSHAMAAEGTAYVAKATSYYKHPVTGKIEDPGNNEGLGQSMTESVLYKKALIEEMDDGSLYATVRIFLTDNINNVRIWTQKSGGSNWKKAVTKIMQENMGGEYCSDYRFAIPEKNAIMKMSFYVTPMGRDVIFFLNFSNWKKGKADFITSLKTSSSSTSRTAKKTGSVKGQSSAGSTVSNQTAGRSVTQTSGSGQDIAGNGTTEKQRVSADRTPGNEQAGSVGKVTEAARNTSPSQTEEPTDGEALVENAEGLTVSDESVLSDPGEDVLATEAADTGQEEGMTDTGSEQKQSETVKFSLSWVLVLQCILIITVPSLLLLSAMTLLQWWLVKTKQEK